MDLPVSHPDGALIVNLIHPDALPPKRSSEGAVGYDLYSIEDLTIPARGKCIARTGVRMVIPRGHYGRMAPRSGLAVKHSIHIGAGVLDPDYRGEILVVLYNFSENDVTLTKSSRIAQVILEKCSVLPVQLVSTDVYDEWTTVRGDGGFGSTGH